MKRLKIGLIMAVLSVSMLAGAAAAQTNGKINCTGYNGLTAAEIADLLDAHNKIRVELGLSKLTWNCALADAAQEWAQRGVAEHREDSFFGENIFVASDNTVSPLDGINRWLNEKNYWNAAAKTCQPGKFCMHYQQMISPATKTLGCGINRDAKGKWPLMMVCNYNPS